MLNGHFCTGEGVLGLAVVEGQLLDDIQVCENLWQNLCKTVDYTEGNIVSGN